MSSPSSPINAAYTIQYNGQTFITNLNDVNSAAELTTTNFTNATAALLAASSNSGTYNFSTYLATFNTAATPPLTIPTTFDGLMSGYLSYLQNKNSLSNNASSTTISAAFLQDYNQALNSPDASWPSPNNFVTSNDWSDITSFASGPTMSTQFQNWFQAFASDYPYSSGTVGTAANAESNFFGNAEQQLTATASIQPISGSNTLYITNLSGAPTDPSTEAPYGPNFSLPSYQQIYAGYFPNGDFSSAMSSFYTTEVTKYGYFNPSQMIGDFTRQTQADYVSSVSTGPVLMDTTSLASEDSNDTLVLNSIFTLVAAMLGTLQNVAAAQANNLITLSNWQAAYTNSLAGMPSFLANGPPMNRLSDSYSGNSSNTTTIESLRSELNTTEMPNLRTNLQNEQSVISDNAKALQSDLNQTNDAVSQQSNVATAIIQELDTILSSIFK